MLDPETRHLLTDALRPPAGFSVDQALATTYTLDLDSVLLAPLAMAAFDRVDTSNPDPAEPHALLESIRRHAGHTTILCQAAGIHVPRNYSRLAAFAEGMVFEVVPPPGRTFHPKIWLLRFVDAEGTRRHRFCCLSRNLTGDKSWDTVLVCDEDAEATYTLDAAPLADFVEELLPSLVRPLEVERQQAVLELVGGFRGARLGLPEPFRAGDVLALGTPSGAEWPLPHRANRWTVVSPFLDVGAVRRLPAATGPRVLISRVDTIERVGRAATQGVETRVLQSAADVADTQEGLEVAHEEAAQGRSRGLHAKLFAWQEGRTAHLVTGSANCTTAAFGGNIEVSVHLTGPAKSCGPGALFGDADQGFMRLTQPYSSTQVEAQPDPDWAVERAIEEWHAALAATSPTLRVLPEEGKETFEIDVSLTLPPDPGDLASHTTIAPTAAKHASQKPLTQLDSWLGLSLVSLTPYLTVTTEIPGSGVAASSVIVCDVQGAPEDRLTQLLRQVLSTPEDVLRYLVLLLGDPSLQALLDRFLSSTDEGEDAAQSGPRRPGFDDLVLLEPLLRAAARGDDSLTRAQRLLEDLDAADGSAVSPGFRALWVAVREAVAS